MAEPRPDDLDVMTLVALQSLKVGKVGLWRVLDPDTTWWSPEMYDMHGLPRGGRPPTALQMFAMYHPDDTNLLGRIWKKLFSEDEPQEIRFRIFRPDGALRHIVSRASRQPPDETGRRWVVGFNVDVSDLMDDAAIFERERSLRFLADNSPDMILRLGADAVIRFASRACKSLTGHTAEELVGREGREFVHPDDLAKVDANYRALLASDGADEGEGGVEFRFRHKDGRWVWLESRPRLARDANGQVLEFVDVVRDVTKRREAEEAAEAARLAAERAAQAKTEFLANMSHELRTPLTSILGFSHLIAQSPTLHPEDARRIGLIQSAGETLLAVVNDILDLSKLEAGAVALTPGDFCPQSLVEEVVALLQPQATAKGLALEGRASGAEALSGDTVRLRQVLMNLAGNALKFTARGGVRIEAACEPRGEDRVGLFVSVIDTGIGIPADRLDAIFERFTQVDSTTSRRFGGTGLGLSISRMLIELMGGRIGAESDGATGSRFWFEVELPRASSQALEAAGPEKIDPEVAPHILLAEDNPAIRQLVAALLQPFGMEVQVVENGAQAVDAVRFGAFDLVLMDMQMPVMDGPSAARAIRALPGPRGQIPIIALTANVMPEQVAVCRAAGMQAHVAKPIQVHELVAAIMAQLSQPPVTAPASSSAEDRAPASAT